MRRTRAEQARFVPLLNACMMAAFGVSIALKHALGLDWASVFVFSVVLGMIAWHVADRLAEWLGHRNRKRRANQ